MYLFIYDVFARDRYNIYRPNKTVVWCTYLGNVADVNLQHPKGFYENEKWKQGFEYFFVCFMTQISVFRI